MSDDSDIEVHPNVDKRSFIRAKQNQIHMERQQRRLQTRGLHYERTINSGLKQRLESLVSGLEAHQHDIESQTPIEVAFRLVIEDVQKDPEADIPPPRPTGIYEEADQPLPTFSQMVLKLVDSVNAELSGVPNTQQPDAFVAKIKQHIQKIQELQQEIDHKLEKLEQPDGKITSDSYHIGFDSSHVTASGSSKPKQSSTTTQVELLNPQSQSQPQDTTDDNQKIRASSVAKQYANIPASNYRASQAFITAHPELLLESEVNGLLGEAMHVALEQQQNGDDRDQTKKVWQYVHQAQILQYGQLLGRDRLAVFFDRVTTATTQSDNPAANAKVVLEKDVQQEYEHILNWAKTENALRLQEPSEQPVERIQLHAVEPGTEIVFRVPDPTSTDDEVKRARAIFDGFPADLQAALQTASLDEVNAVLENMDVAEAEKIVALLSDVSPVPFLAGFSPLIDRGQILF